MIGDELDGAAQPTGFVGEESFVHRRIIGGITGFLGGGPAGAVAGVLAGGGGRRRPAIAPPGQVVVRAPGVGAAVARAVPGGRTGLMVAPTGTALATTRIGCMSGHHPNKSDYWLRDGTFVPKGSRCVKNRRRNPMNPRALSRAIGRVDAGKALQGKLAEITTKKWTASGKRK